MRKILNVKSIQVIVEDEKCGDLAKGTIAFIDKNENQSPPPQKKTPQSLQHLKNEKKTFVEYV